MYKTPDFVNEYYQRRPPKCCHTCDHFLVYNATCRKFNQAVPEQFAQEIDSCPDWSEAVVPF